MMIDSRVYPNMDVEPNLYQIYILNNCNSHGLIITFTREDTVIVVPFKLYK
jgi:hypothetical protein